MKNNLNLFINLIIFLPESKTDDFDAEDKFVLHNIKERLSTIWWHSFWLSGKCNV